MSKILKKVLKLYPDNPLLYILVNFMIFSAKRIHSIKNIKKISEFRYVMD